MGPSIKEIALIKQLSWITLSYLTKAAFYLQMLGYGVFPIFMSSLLLDAVFLYVCIFLNQFKNLKSS